MTKQLSATVYEFRYLSRPGPVTSLKPRRISRYVGRSQAQRRRTALQHLPLFGGRKGPKDGRSSISVVVVRLAVFRFPSHVSAAFWASEGRAGPFVRASTLRAFSPQMVPAPFSRASYLFASAATDGAAGAMIDHYA